VHLWSDWRLVLTRFTVPERQPNDQDITDLAVLLLLKGCLMSEILVSGLINIETTVRVDRFRLNTPGQVPVFWH